MCLMFMQGGLSFFLSNLGSTVHTVTSVSRSGLEPKMVFCRCSTGSAYYVAWETFLLTMVVQSSYWSCWRHLDSTNRPPLTSLVNIYAKQSWHKRDVFLFFFENYSAWNIQTSSSGTNNATVTSSPTSGIRVNVSWSPWPWISCVVPPSRHGPAGRLHLWARVRVLLIKQWTSACLDSVCFSEQIIFLLFLSRRNFMMNLPEQILS